MPTLAEEYLTHNKRNINEIVNKHAVKGSKRNIKDITKEHAKLLLEDWGDNVRDLYHGFSHQHFWSKPNKQIYINQGNEIVWTNSYFYRQGQVLSQEDIEAARDKGFSIIKLNHKKWKYSIDRSNL